MAKTVATQNVVLKNKNDKLEEENEELQRKLQAETDRADFHENNRDVAKIEPEVAAPEVEQDQVASVSSPAPQAAEPRVLHDPYESQNPHKFISHPQDFRLGWKNPKYRDGGRGWRGWMPVEYTSDIGRSLSKYLLDPPRRMEHATDNVVRRGDAILCYLPEAYWLARQEQRTTKANRLSAQNKGTTTIEQPTQGKFASVDAPSEGRRIGGSSLPS